jgi:hypothetical protein
VALGLLPCGFGFDAGGTFTVTLLRDLNKLWRWGWRFGLAAADQGNPENDCHKERARMHVVAYLKISQ